eukprot:9925216-Heterocapsa_arctica.AAC.1
MGGMSGVGDMYNTSDVGGKGSGKSKGMEDSEHTSKMDAQPSPGAASSTEKPIPPDPSSLPPTQIGIS